MSKRRSCGPVVRAHQAGVVTAVRAFLEGTAPGSSRVVARDSSASNPAARSPVFSARAVLAGSRRRWHRSSVRRGQPSAQRPEPDRWTRSRYPTRRLRRPGSPRLHWMRGSAPTLVANAPVSPTNTIAPIRATPNDEPNAGRCTGVHRPRRDPMRRRGVHDVAELGDHATHPDTEYGHGDTEDEAGELGLDCGQEGEDGKEGDAKTRTDDGPPDGDAHRGASTGPCARRSPTPIGSGGAPCREQRRQTHTRRRGPGSSPRS